MLLQSRVVAAMLTEAGASAERRLNAALRELAADGHLFHALYASAFGRDELGAVVWTILYHPAPVGLCPVPGCGADLLDDGSCPMDDPALPELAAAHAAHRETQR